jgi:hypothetical protein
MESRSQEKPAGWRNCQRDSAGFFVGICRRVEEGENQGWLYPCRYEKGEKMTGWYIAGWVMMAATIGWLAVYQPNDRIAEEMNQEINEHQRHMKALKKAVSK